MRLQNKTTDKSSRAIPRLFRAPFIIGSPEAAANLSHIAPKDTRRGKIVDQHIERLISS